MTKKKELEAKVEAKAKPVLEKVEVSFRQVGKNLNIVLGDKKVTRTGEKEELTEIKEAIKTYDSKPTKANLVAIQKLLKPVSVAKEKEVETTKAEVKSEKNKSKEASKGISKEAKKISSDLKKSEVVDTKISKEEASKVSKKVEEVKKVEQPVAHVNRVRRSGEH